MPQVKGTIIKQRAAQLRATGIRQVKQHLAAQVGQTHQILMESSNMGRTAQFAEVTFDVAHPEGQLVSKKIKSHTDDQLIA